jgi:hypothetical protein
VHRDIKPSNLLLWKKGLVKILDLGLARLNSERAVQGEALTMQGEILGTPDYMAPEQWNSPNTAGPAADLYALGCTLVYLLTGKAVFSGEEHSNFSQKMKGHVLETPPKLRELRADVPEELEALCAKLLAKLPADRPASAKEVAVELQGMIKRWNQAAPASDAIAWTRPEEEPRAKEPKNQEGVSRGKSRIRWLVAVVLLVAAAAGAWIFGMRRDGTTSVAPAVKEKNVEKEAVEAAALAQAKKLYGLGRELSFVSDDWVKGRELLADGHDAGVAAAARKEMEGVLTPEAQAEAGKLWYEAGLAIKEEPDNWHCFRRARYWLTKAVGAGTQRSDAPWWDEAQKTLDLIPVLRSPLMIKVHSFNSEFITIERNKIEWVSRTGAGPNKISNPRTAVSLPEFHSNYEKGVDRHVFGREEVRKVLPEGVDFSLARLRTINKEGETSAWANAVIVPERSDDTKVTIRVAEWDSKNNRIGNYQGRFTFELLLGFGGDGSGKGKGK